MIIEHIYEGKIIWRTQDIAPRVKETVILKGFKYTVTDVIHLVEKKIIQVHLV